MGELRASFPGVPVYVALGNNDTACGDYRLDAGSDFLAQTGRIVAEGLPPSQRQQALKEFAKGGYYSLTMEAPMRDTRLIVVNDIFLSPKYSTCAGTARLRRGHRGNGMVAGTAGTGAAIGSKGLGHGSHPAGRRSLLDSCKDQGYLRERGA